MNHDVYLIYLILSDLFSLGICHGCALEIWQANGECYLCRSVN